MTGRINRCSHCGCDEPILGIDGKLYCDNCGMSLEKLEGGLTMAENKMEQVAAMFGKELGEEFRVRRNYYLSCSTVKARFIDRGFQVLWDGNDYWEYRPKGLIDLLTGKAEIVGDEK